MTQALRGILAAVVTPMDSNGEIAEVPLRALVDRLIGAGVSGLVPCGSTGEFPYLTTEERRRVTQICVSAASGRIPVIAQTGSLTTAETVSLSIDAEADGAAGVMVVAPFYESLKWRELVAHYRAVRDAVVGTVVYYNLPSVTGLRLNPGQLAKLCTETGIEYVKDTGGDAIATAELIREHADTVTTLVGWDSLTYFGFANGAPGSIWGAANFIPELCVDLYTALVVDQDLKRAQAVWSLVWPICRFLESEDYTAAVKAACRLSGLDVGLPRRPLQDLSPDSHAALQKLLEAAVNQYQSSNVEAVSAG